MRTCLFPLTVTLATLVVCPATAAPAVRTYTLTAQTTSWQVAPGRTVSAYTYGGTIPGPALRADPGDELVVTLVNHLPVPTTVHWHGVPVPNGMDGVPGLTAPVVPPGGSFTYRFIAPAPGTYWYHPHHDSMVQIARGLYGLLIVDPPPHEKGWDQEIPVVIGELGVSGMGSGMGGPMSGVAMGGGTLVINGKTAPAVPDVRVRKGERVLFRMVNTGNGVHPMHVHGLHWLVTATDGFALAAPYRKDTLPVHAGERYDGILVADNPGTWLVHCHNLQHVSEAGAAGGTGLTFRLVVEE